MAYYRIQLSEAKTGVRRKNVRAFFSGLWLFSLHVWRTLTNLDDSFFQGEYLFKGRKHENDVVGLRRLSYACRIQLLVLNRIFRFSCRSDIFQIIFRFIVKKRIRLRYIFMYNKYFLNKWYVYSWTKIVWLYYPYNFRNVYITNKILLTRFE